MGAFERVNRAIRQRLLSKEEKVKESASLSAEVEFGDWVEHFFKSPIWEKIICSWLEEEEGTADRRLRDFTHAIPQDVVGFWEQGKIALIEDFRSMLEEKIKQKAVAQQKLLELQLTGEKDARRERKSL